MYHDSVTGLPNFEDFLDFSKKMWASSPSNRFAILSTNIGSFRTINQVYGYAQMNLSETANIFYLRAEKKQTISFFYWTLLKSDFQKQKIIFINFFLILIILLVIYTLTSTFLFRLVYVCFQMEFFHQKRRLNMPALHKKRR